LSDIAAVVRRRLPRAVIEIGPGDNFLGMPYPPHGVYDVTRARNELGFTPEYDIDRAIADYIASLERMRAQGERDA
jgi:UDP-glucose 4-epimerase